MANGFVARNGIIAQNNSTVSGSLIVTQGVTGSLQGTASYATTASFVQTAQTASYVLNAVSSSYSTTASYVTTAQTASYVLQAVSASYSTTASYVTGSIHNSTNPALSASYALTASYALNGGGGGGSVSIDSLTAATLRTITFSSSFVYNGSNGTIQTLTLTGSVTGSVQNLLTGIPYTFIVKQDSTGSRSIYWNTAIKVAYGGTGSLPISTTANAIDKYNFIYDGTNIYADYGINYT